MAAILPVILGYAIGVIKKALNNKLSKELKKEGIEPSRVLDLFICEKDLEFTVSKLGIKGLMLIYDCDKLDIDDIRTILNNKEIVNGLSSIHENNLKLILSKFSGDYIKTILSNQEVVNRLKSISKKKLELILNAKKFGVHYIIEILKNQEAADRFNFINESTLILILNSDKFGNHDITKI
ncbi:MAG: hypothetical protein PG981_000339 [Wolbachia endosymbiont of Ctenocephalides orientis wCori]|nr:MAG: hypothetical protein PG981_000339 [Wolbachia endosymbiont of Ctenocephalides orientis wCori]